MGIGSSTTTTGNVHVTTETATGAVDPASVRFAVVMGNANSVTMILLANFAKVRNNAGDVVVRICRDGRAWAQSQKTLDNNAMHAKSGLHL